MFRTFLSRFFKAKRPPRQLPTMGEYVVLSWTAINTTLGKAQREHLEHLINEVATNSPAHLHENLLVIKVPANTARGLIELAATPTPTTRH